MESKKLFEYHFNVMLHDTDAAGLLFFAHLLRHAHDGYERFMHDAGYPLKRLLDEGELLLPIRHAESDYLLPIRYAEAITINIEVGRVSQSAFTLQYQFFNQQNGLVAEAKTVHVAIRKSCGKKIALPKVLLAALGCAQPPK